MDLSSVSQEAIANEARIDMLREFSLRWDPTRPQGIHQVYGKDFNDNGVKASNLQSETDINEHDDAAEKVLDNHPGARIRWSRSSKENRKNALGNFVATIAPYCPQKRVDLMMVWIME